MGVIKILTIKDWRIWDNYNGFYYSVFLSNKNTKELLQFESIGDCISHLSFNGNEELARQINNKWYKGA